MRTSAEIIGRVCHWLKFFTLAELIFVLNEDARMSVFDKFRIEKISFSLRHTFFSDQSDRHVKMLIDDLSLSYFQARPVHKPTSLSSITTRQNNHTLVPFQSSCPTCNCTLNPHDTFQRRIRLYCQNGSVVTGKLFTVKAAMIVCFKCIFCINTFVIIPPLMILLKYFYRINWIFFIFSHNDQSSLSA